MLQPRLVPKDTMPTWTATSLTLTVRAPPESPWKHHSHSHRPIPTFISPSSWHATHVARSPDARAGGADVGSPDGRAEVLRALSVPDDVDVYEPQHRTDRWRCGDNSWLTHKRRFKRRELELRRERRQPKLHSQTVELSPNRPQPLTTAGAPANVFSAWVVDGRRTGRM